jgi:hypothetical protein
MLDGKNAEAASAGDAIHRKIALVHGEDGLDRFPLGKVNQRRVGKIGKKLS